MARRRNPLERTPSNWRSLLHPSDVRRIDRLHASMLEAQALADEAYRFGRLLDADEADARADELAEQLEAMLAEMEGEAGEREEDQKGLLGSAMGPEPAAEIAALAYAEHLDAVSGRPSVHWDTLRSPTEYLVYLLRARLTSAYGPLLPSVTDAQLVEAARDAYEAKQALLVRQRGGTSTAALKRRVL